MTCKAAPACFGIARKLYAQYVTDGSNVSDLIADIAERIYALVQEQYIREWTLILHIGRELSASRYIVLSAGSIFDGFV
jgi:hypothetical protein